MTMKPTLQIGNFWLLISKLLSAGCISCCLATYNYVNLDSKLPTSYINICEVLYQKLSFSPPQVTCLQHTPLLIGIALRVRARIRGELELVHFQYIAAKLKTINVIHQHLWSIVNKICHIQWRCISSKSSAGFMQVSLATKNRSKISARKLECQVLPAYFRLAAAL